MQDVRQVHGGVRDYSIYFRCGAASELAERLMALVGPNKLCVLSDERVAQLHASAFVQGLMAKGMDVHLLTVPQGEASKTLACADHLYEQLTKLGVDRQSVIVCYGGGVIGDLGGYVAATYLRGLPFVQVPTTVLAQVDSSVGGKVGVNAHGGKNLVGAFYEPEFVWIDVMHLQTLERHEILNGSAEIVKHALIGNPQLLDVMNAQQSELLAGDPETWFQLLPRAIDVKIRAVETDFKEGSVRRYLNFGHTLGHALEASTTFQGFTHGQAVAIGMRAMLRLSVTVCGLSKKDAAKAERFLDTMGFPQLSQAMLDDAVLECIRWDKKRFAERYRLVFLNALGSPQEELYEWTDLKGLFGSLRAHPLTET